MVQKQEAAVGQNEAEETVEQCIARIKSEHPEMSDEEARAQCTQQPADEAEKGDLQAQIIGVMKDYGKTLATEIKRDIAAEMDKVIKETKDEMVTGIRKGLGLMEDPVVHLSEVEHLVRKITLDEQPHGKRTETLTTDKPAEGSTDEPKTLPSADDLYKRLTKDRGAI